MANRLLTYASVSADSTTFEAETDEIPLVILYDRSVSAETFTATLNGTDISSLFKPSPGRIEAVNVPLVTGRNELVLSIERTFENEAIDTDTLVFVVN